MAGRKPHAPTERDRQQVETMAAVGITEVDIGLILGIDPKTLRKHYRAELDLGHVRANAKVAASLFKAATQEEQTSWGIRAAMFWLQTRAGWSTVRPELPGIPQAAKLGKKEIAYNEALAAGDDSDWGDDLKPPGVLTN